MWGELVVYYDDGLSEQFFMYDADVEEFVNCFPSIYDYDFHCIPEQ